MLGALRSVDRAIAQVERTVALLAMAGVVGLLVGQVFFRYVLLSPLFFAEEVALLLLIVATFTGLSLLVHERRLVTVDLVGPWLGAGGQVALRRAMGVIVLFLGIAMTAFAIRYVATPWVWAERSATLAMPRAVIQVFFAVEMVFLSLHQAVALIHPGEQHLVPGGSA